MSTRSHVASAQRIVVKAGTSVVSTSTGLPALSRIANIVEQCCQLQRSGKQVLLVSSGAIGCGRRKMIKQKFFMRAFCPHGPLRKYF